MKNTKVNTAIAAMFMVMVIGAVPPAARADKLATQQRMIVCVYNYAKVPAAILSKARRVASKAFAHAGVETTWPGIASTQQEPGKESDCPTSGPRIFVKIFDRELAESFNLPSNMLGVAPGAVGEPNRVMVYVFDHIADSLVRKQTYATKPVILGYAIAHEICHILANMDHHSRSGIMKANWNQEDFQSMSVGKLKFNPDQITSIRNEVIRRNRMATEEVAAPK